MNWVHGVFRLGRQIDIGAVRFGAKRWGRGAYSSVGGTYSRGATSVIYSEMSAIFLGRMAHHES